MSKPASPPENETGSLPRLSLCLPTNQLGQSRFARRLCKLCDATDYRDKEWFNILCDMNLGWLAEPGKPYRKAWEWAHGVYGLIQLGFLNDSVRALSIGAGKEIVLYYLANHVGHVVATDIYGSDTWGSEAPKQMLEHPELFAPFPYRIDHLSVRYMDGRYLHLDDDSFDVVFSFSAIEHFGGHAAATQAMREMGRVVRPGGMVVIATELILNGLPDLGRFLPDLALFLPDQVHRELIDPSGLRLVEDIDFSISDETLKTPVLSLDSIDKSLPIPPHFIIRFGNWFWTSVLFFLEKPLR